MEKKKFWCSCDSWKCLLNVLIYRACSHCFLPFLARTLGLRRPGVSSMVGVLLILAFTSHVSYLTFVSFDYGYNMAANATIGTAHAHNVLY